MTELAQDGDTFPLLLISAWNDSGGGFTHRLLDGHPAFYTYPFELQLGTGQVRDQYADWFHAKYRWPEFDKKLETLSSDDIFHAIIDQELKSTITDPTGSKFKQFPINVSFEEWQPLFKEYYATMPSGRRSLIIAYITSFFNRWQGRVKSGTESIYMGHCPIINVDANKIFQDFPEAKIIQIVRSPLPGFADMRHRRPEVELESYCQKWNAVNKIAYQHQQQKPQNFKIVHYRDLLTDRRTTMHNICNWLAIDFNEVTLEPSWNGQGLSQLYPFGGVRTASLEHEMVHLSELSQDQQSAIKLKTQELCDILEITITD